jgi:hypothetical protein
MEVTVIDPVVVAEPVIEREIEVIENLPSENKTESAPVQLIQKESSKPPVKKRCTKKGVHIFTKSGLLQICNDQMNLVLVVPACAGKSSTPTYPWTFRAQRYKPGYTNTQSGLKLYYSVFFFKGLAIAGVDKVAKAPCSNGSVFIQKKYSKEVYEYIKANDPLIYVKAN